MKKFYNLETTITDQAMAPEGRDTKHWQINKTHRQALKQKWIKQTALSFSTGKDKELCQNFMITSPTWQQQKQGTMK